MKVLGLDISSTSTGWAIIKNGRFYRRDGVDFGLIVPVKDVHLSSKLSFFRENIILLLEKNRPDIVGIEDVFLHPKFSNPKTLKILSEFRGVAREAVWTIAKIEPNIVPVKEIRAIFGTQDKRELFLDITKRFCLNGWKFETKNDITDAIAVAYFVYKKNRSK